MPCDHNGTLELPPGSNVAICTRCGWSSAPPREEATGGEPEPVSNAEELPSASSSEAGEDEITALLRDLTGCPDIIGLNGQSLAAALRSRLSSQSAEIAALREGVEKLRLPGEDRREEGFNAALDDVLALFPTPPTAVPDAP